MIKKCTAAMLVLIIVLMCAGLPIHAQTENYPITVTFNRNATWAKAFMYGPEALSKRNVYGTKVHPKIIGMTAIALLKPEYRKGLLKKKDSISALRRQIMKDTLIMKCPTMWHGDMGREGMPVGNGKIGGLVYGGVYKELISITDSKLWTKGVTQDMGIAICGDLRNAPIQLDAIMGLSAAINEMLVFSTENNIYLFNAMPKRFAQGAANGVFTRTGYKVSLKWDENTACVILQNNHCKSEVKVVLPENMRFEINNSRSIIIKPTENQVKYEIKVL